MSTPPRLLDMLTLVCGCRQGDDAHTAECVLGAAETIALQAADTASILEGHQLLAALTALRDAGLLRDLHRLVDWGDELKAKHTPSEVLLGVLDALWEADLIGPAEATSAVAR